MSESEETTASNNGSPPPSEENGDSNLDIIQAHNKIFYDSFPFESHKFNRLLVMGILHQYIRSNCSVTKPVKCVDVLSDSGGNGLLWKLYFRSKVDVVVNNYFAKSVELIQRNASLNNLFVVVSNKDPCVLLHERGYSFVYLDCTTEAAQYFDAAFRNIARNGILIVTTKDDSSLHGGNYDVALRRYGGRIVRTCYSTEMGIRLFLAALAKSAARHNKSIKVLCCTVYKSTFTVAIMSVKGPALANKTLDNIRSLKHCMVCEERMFYPAENGFPTDHNSIKLPCSCGEGAPGETAQVLGPLWAGELFDIDCVQNILHHSRIGDSHVEQELTTILEEARCPSKESDGVGGKRLKLDYSSSPPFYYNLHKHLPRISQQLSTNKMIEELRNAGYRASRTHFDKVSVRTNAPMKKVYEIMKKASEK